MAKQKTGADNAPSDAVSADKSEVDAAVKLVCAVTGCGRMDAQTRVGKMGPEKVKKLAELEKSNRRKDAVSLLFS